MAAKVVLTLDQKWKVHKISIGIAALLVFLCVGSSKGADAENTPVSSSQQNWERKLGSNVSVHVRESIRDTRTVGENVINDVTGERTGSNILITSTEVVGKSSYAELGERERLETTSRWDANEEDSADLYRSQAPGGQSKSQGSDDFYDAIKPTKTMEAGKKKIDRTDQGEAEGVSIPESRPRHEDLSRKIFRRSPEFNNSAEFSEDLPGKFLKDTKYVVKQRVGKNYNKIEQELGKIAKIALIDKKEVSGGEVTGNRKSREEENRKASPDIQDIITGIVKILNGKTSGNHVEGSTGRPVRPSGTRINNRGPPRISDVPPLDFDPPPSFVPLPPPPPKRPSSPYPFDTPPPLPSIPLPPQPPKPNQSKLPSHPFIEGVPIPEMIIPEQQHPSNPEYDTISMSVPHPANIPLLTIPTKPLEEHVPTTEILPKNTTNKELNKNKVNNEKLGANANFPNKNGNKRVRPRPGLRPRPTNTTRIVPKPILMKNVTLILSPPTETTKNSSSPENATTPVPDVKVGGDSVTEVEVVNTTPQPQPAANATTTEVIPVNKTEVEEDPIVKEHAISVLLEPSIGIGEATPVVESSILELSSSIEPVPTATPMLVPTRPIHTTSTTHEFKVRPGIVLDDPEYKPVGHKHPILTQKPIITAPPPHSHGHFGEIFDITVHAVQGPGGEEATSNKPFRYPVNPGVILQNVPDGDVSVITKPEEGQDFVSIDGKRTYINLFGESSTKPVPIPSATQPPAITGTGYAVPHKEPVHQTISSRPISTPPPRRPYKRPSHPPVRIDTCIVGDDTTCDSAQNEACRTEDGVSSCHCRPGYNRRKHRDPCRRVVSMLTSLRVDKLYDRKVRWQESLRDPDSEDYQQLSYEANQAIESAMSMTPFSDDFINSRINSIYSGKNLETNEPAVYINITLQLEENLDTIRPAVKHDIQHHLLRVIQRRNNNVGNSAIWVNSPPGSILALQDLDECSSAELHDCHQRATCSNTFGGFKCECPEGSRDPWIGNVHRQGRHCETCSSEFCNNRGECRFEQGQQVCHCTGSFYGSQCEVDGEVLGVAIGASVAAAIIIVLTLVCLCMWSRKWSREQKSAVGAGMGSPVFGYMATGPAVKTPNVGGPPYQVSIEDRIRWAQIADVMAQANHYAQPEPGNGATRTSFGGYPTLPAHTLSTKGTLPLSTVTPPVPLPRLSLPNKAPLSTYGAYASQHGSVHQRSNIPRTSLDTTSSSEEEDRADLLGRHFNAPRPKSRTSVANQSGIYYDVDYDRSDVYSKQNTIPMNTYTLNPQHQVRTFFR